MTLTPSASNVQTVPAGSLIINSDSTMMSPVAGTYTTIYGTMTFAQPPVSGTPSGGSTSGMTSINPGGPMQPVMTATAKAPAPAAPAAKPAVQVVSAMGAVTVADNGTLTPTGSANLAFPASGIGGSLPLSLPSASPAQPTQLAFPPTDQNAVFADPIFQGLVQKLGQQGQPSAPLPAPIPNLVPNTGTAIASQAAPDATPGNFVQLASLNGVPQPDTVPMAQAGQPAASGAQANLSPSGAVATSPAQSQDAVTLPPLPSAPAAGYIRVWDPTSNTYADYPAAGNGNVPVTPNTIYIGDNDRVYAPQGVQPGDAAGVPAAPGINFYVPLDYVQPLQTIMPDSSTGLPSLNGSIPVIPQATIDQATRSLLNPEQPAPPPGSPTPANPPANFPSNPPADTTAVAMNTVAPANAAPVPANPVPADAAPAPVDATPSAPVVASNPSYSGDPTGSSGFGGGGGSSLG